MNKPMTLAIVFTISVTITLAFVIQAPLAQEAQEWSDTFEDASKIESSTTCRRSSKR